MSVTSIRLFYGTPKPQPREGDLAERNGVQYRREHETWCGCYVVRHGRYAYRWRRLSDGVVVERLPRERKARA